ncbi:MAG: formate--tetrahydrofolate ligase [Oscillospiraceae bacterium]|nr:formate--tetrahydrofolate ligase [Oscillospiraceae bacterium]
MFSPSENLEIGGIHSRRSEIDRGAPAGLAPWGAMPGLPKVPAAEKIDVDENGVISGLF